jgi:hypothetical protein
MQRSLPKERRRVAELEQRRGLVGQRAYRDVAGRTCSGARLHCVSRAQAPRVEDDPGRRARVRERRGCWWATVARGLWFVVGMVGSRAG